MKRFHLSKAAQNDLRRIWHEGIQEWGASHTEAYLRMLDEAFHMLGDHPAAGRHCDDIRQGYRCFPKGAHFIYYRFADNGILVVRIRPQRMLPRM